MGTFKVTHTLTDEEDHIDTAREIVAGCANDAAESFARRYDTDGDYTLSQGDELEVSVKCMTTGEISRYACHAEVVIHYTAIEVDPIVEGIEHE